MKLTKSINNIVLIFFLLSSLYSIFLCSKGVMSLADENRYYETVLALESLSQKNINGFVNHLINTQLRPGESIMRIPSAFIQGVIYKIWEIPPSNFDSLKIPLAFNVLIHLLLLYLFYKLCVIILNSKKQALFALLLYKLMINSNVYIRHVLPYENGLLVFIIILYLFYKNRTDNKSRYFLFGLLSGIAFSIYPGYYFIPIFIGILVLFSELSVNFKFKTFILKGFTVFTGFVSVFIFFECLYSTDNQSYLESCISTSDMISQGSFDESLLFPIKYLIEVEGISGWIILFSTTTCIILILNELLRKKSILPIYLNPVYQLFLISILGMVLHGIMGTVFHKMVFYGRLMHLYIPFLVLTLVYVIHKSQFSKGLSIVTLLIFMINFFFFSIQYFKLGYPKSMLYAYKIDNRNFSKDRFYNETDSILYPLLSPNALNKETNYPYSNDTSFLLVNCALITPITDPNDYRKFRPDSGLTLLASQPYYFAFPAYAFEGMTPVERKHAKERNYHVQFYSTSD